MIDMTLQLRLLVEKYLLDDDICKYLDTKDFIHFYDHIFVNHRTLMSELLISCDINPLEGMSYVPVRYLAYTLLSDVVIPESIEVINTSAFESASIKQVKIPKSVTVLSLKAFAYSKLMSLELADDGDIEIGPSAFISTPLQQLKTNCKIKQIMHHAFYGCKLVSIYLPNVSWIDDEAFKHCSQLVDVTLGSTLRNIGSECFHHCDSLTTIKYLGTSDAWNKIKKAHDWCSYSPVRKIVCIDKEIYLDT